MTHVYRWRKTKYGPLCDGLQGRFGEPCRIFARGLNRSLGIEFADGARFVVPMYAVRRADGIE